MTFTEAFKNAQWVGPDAQCRAPYMREIIQLDGEVSDATISICGLGFFELYINGARVSGDVFAPVTSDYCKREFTVCGKPFPEVLRHRVYFVKYDVSGYLRPGSNSVCVALGPGWFAQPIWSDPDCSPRYGDVRLAYILTAHGSDGSESAFVSGPQIKWAQGPVCDYDLFTGECQDMTLSRDGWLEADYDDSDWRASRVLDDLDTVYMEQDCPADAVIRHIRPRKVGEKDGALIYDIGENISGTPVLLARGGAGDVVELRMAEELENGALDEAHAHDQHETFTLDGEPRTLRARFTWFGFRYFSVKGPADAVDCLVIHSNIPVTAQFDSDNDTLNWLFDAYIRTQLCNMHAGIPSDCPHIERRGYTGDGQLVCQSAMITLDAQAFYRKWLRDIEDCQDDITGHVQYTAPYTRCGGGPGGWGCAIVHVPYCYYLQYGDSEPMRRMLPRMLKYFEYLEAHSENKLVVSDNPGQWCLGDWCAPGVLEVPDDLDRGKWAGPDAMRIPDPFVNNYFYIRSMREVLAICNVLGIHDYDDMLNARIDERIKAIMDTYFDPATGNFAENEQGANAFAIDLGLGDERTFENMVRHYDEIGCFDTGIFGTDIVPRVLFERGHAQTAFNLLASEKPVSFERMRANGATTLWEEWPIKMERSHSHPMFGGVVRYLFEYLLGIGHVGAGWDNAEIKPQPVLGLNYVSGSIMTPRGRIAVRINRVDDQLIIDVHMDDPKGAVFTMGDVKYELTDTDSQFIAMA